jgi:hypothetical protein
VIFPDTMRMEHFQLGIVRSIMSANGISISRIEADYNKTDITLEWDTGGQMRKFDVQLKSTQNLPSNGVEPAYDLDAGTFNVLRSIEKSPVPRFLMVMELPTNFDEWAEFLPGEIQMRRRMFMKSLYSLPETKNTSTVRVSFADDELLSHNTLKPFLAKTYDEWKSKFTRGGA